jgi:hypothetical protein
MSATARLRAEDATTPLLTFRLHLQNASRVNPDSCSNKSMRKMLRDPSFLDDLERVLAGVSPPAKKEPT